MANGGGDVGASSDSDGAWLPLDIIIAEIATRSDPATLVRCAATCRAARRRISEDTNLLLRDTGLFVPALLRGHLVGFTSFDDEWGAGLKTDVYLVDTTTTTTLVVEATFASDAAGAETLTDPVPVESRGGLVLVRATATRPHDTLLVCNPATGCHLVLPPETTEPFQYGGGSVEEQYVLLVGDRDDGAGAGVGRRFQVLKVKLLLSNSNDRRLMVQTFSSEHGAWSPCTTEIPTPNIHGRIVTVAANILVVGDVVHWLCLTEVRSYVLMLHVREATVSETALPPTFSRYGITSGGIRSYLLATTDSAGGSLVVLVADAVDNNIRAWEQCNDTKMSKMWKAWPHVVIDRKAILGFNDEMKEAVLRCKDEVARRWTAESKLALELLCFGERSGVVLLRTHGCCLLWLDLHSKKIIRCYCSVPCMSYTKVYCPYELDLSSWAPTFSATVTI